MEIYRGAEVPDYVDIRGNNVCFTEGDVAVATFYRADAIGAAKAILKHFGEECDAAAERDEEIARLRSALADAERHRDEAAQKAQEAEDCRVGERHRRKDTERRLGKALDEKDEEIELLKESAGGDYAALRDKIRDLEADNALLRDHREALRLQLKEAAWVEVNHPAELLGRDLENTDLELALEAKDRLLDHYRAVVADLSAREE